MRIRDVGLLWMSSSRKFGASVEGLRLAERLVMFNAPPDGSSQCSQLPNMKSIWYRSRCSDMKS